MKKLLICILSAFIVLGGTACSNNGSSVENKSAISNFVKPVAPIKLDEKFKFSMGTQDLYHYDYMGFEFSLPEKLNKMIDEKALYFQADSMLYFNPDAEKDSKKGIEYAYVYLNYVPEEIRNQNITTAEEHKEWMKKTKRVATIGLFKKDSPIFKEYSILDITGCEKEILITESENGKYSHYLTTTDIPELNISQLITKDMIKTFDLAKISDDQYVEITAQARNEEVNSINDFKTVDINGKEVTPEIFSNYDLTMVNLWTTTCGYCIEEMPYLEEIRSEMEADGKKFNIVGIVMDVAENGKIDDKMLKEAKELVKMTGINYQTLIPDNVLEQGRLKGVVLFPETFFVDKNGNIVGETYIGAHSKDEWKEIINKELADVYKK